MRSPVIGNSEESALEVFVRRVRYEKNGGPEVLFVEEAPVPEPGPG
ncbi:hypothetical protein G3I76_07480, partial [Streptomyces sp. SID11233]|nr:hypothetical protein [Streptomyces sp. SID11233]